MSEMEESESEDSSDEDWEEVKHKSEASESDDEIKDEDLADYNPIVSQEGIQVKIETEGGSRDKKTDWKARKEAYLRLRENRRRRKVQINLHKSSFLIHFSRGVYLNNLATNDEEISCIAFSLLPFIFNAKKDNKRGKRRDKNESTTIQFVEGIETNQINQQFVKVILKSYRDSMTLDPDYEMEIESESDYFRHGRLDEKTSLVHFLDKKVTSRVSSYSLGFISILRSIRRLNARLQVRLCLAIRPIEQKPQLVLSEKQKSKRKKSGSTQSSSKSSSSGFGSGNSIKSESVKSSPGSSKSSSPVGDAVPVKRSRRASSTSHSSASQQTNPEASTSQQTNSQSSTSQQTNSQSSTSQQTNSQSSASQKTNSRPKRAASKKAQVVSEDSEDTDIEVIEIESPKRRKKLSKGQSYIEFWTEIYLVSESKWIAVDPVNNKIGDASSFSNVLFAPDFNYVISLDDHGHCREVTPRYTNRFMLSEFKRLRVDDDWIQKTMKSFQPGYKTKQDEEEDIQLKLEQECQPLPTSLSEFKNHPLYLLARHLLVSEVIRGQDGKEAIPVGTFRGEAVYSRKDVHPVKSKEYWMRSAKVVREDEEPAKTVKGRKKWDKYSNKYITDIPKFLYGEWQTDPFIPPTATDGKVPKNTFGNVELFQPEMIPFGCVHLRIQGLARVAGKLGIDCPQAVVGFDNAKHGVHPVYDGYVVCEEFKEILLEAVEEEKREKRKKEAEKKEKRVINNWKKIVKALLIRERLRKKYKESP